MSKSPKIDAATRILNAASALIAEEGADALRTREILRRAGVSNVSAINYYFGSLDQLRLRVLERYFESARAIVSHLEEEADPRDALLEFCHRAERFVLAHPALERNILFQALSGDPQTSTPFSKLLAEILGVLATLIEKTQTEPDPLKARHEAITLASATVYPLLLASYGTNSVGIDFSNERERDKYYAHLVDLILGKPIVIRPQQAPRRSRGRR